MVCLRVKTGSLLGSVPWRVTSPLGAPVNRTIAPLAITMAGSPPYCEQLPESGWVTAGLTKHETTSSHSCGGIQEPTLGSSEQLAVGSTLAAPSPVYFSPRGYHPTPKLELVSERNSKGGAEWDGRKSVRKSLPAPLCPSPPI